MSWREYKKYKAGGKVFKAPWVKKFWDSVDLDENQYALMRKADIILLCIMYPCIFFIGFVLSFLLWRFFGL